MPLWVWLIGAGVVLFLALFVSPVMIVAALTLLIAGLIALAKRTPTWLRLRSTKTAAGAVAAGALLIVISSGSMAAVAGRATPQRIDAVGFAHATPTATQTSGASTTSRPTSPATSRPTPTPVTTTRQEQVTEVIAFAESTVDAPDLPQGQTALVVAGQNGVRTLTYTVTVVNGVETSRSVISDVVSMPPVDQVLGVGSYVEPPPAAEPAADPGSGCDSNYADDCVPIASDVDCGSGSGDGPAYFYGVARVVGSDVYGLDRDGDGYACEPN